MSEILDAMFKSHQQHNAVVLQRSKPRLHLPCDGGFISSHGIMSGPCSHVAYIPALQVCKGLGIHGVVA